ncbi:MAG: hypothetical protein O7D30_12575, partial [Rickettsia endosymbiont of Ixodes persulcatus]|nr:hypothetical protein [Rickettsia endosymbiont of Ixodes persulcatus]
ALESVWEEYINISSMPGKRIINEQSIALPLFQVLVKVIFYTRRNFMAGSLIMVYDTILL